MFVPTNYTTDIALFQQACETLPKHGSKITINKPTGNFFYDKWTIKDEYKDTVWETLYNSLPVDKGEARIIILDPGQCYQSHADIDDRYHLNIYGDECYLVDLIRESMHLLKQDGIWYDMDAGMLHSAVNFGRASRIQLVVRKLLKRNKLKNPIAIRLTSNIENKNHIRNLFDRFVSPWLNEANKNGTITNFIYNIDRVSFDVEQEKIQWLQHILPNEIEIAYE